jgi:hypothetical protein
MKQFPFGLSLSKHLHAGEPYDKLGAALRQAQGERVGPFGLCLSKPSSTANSPLDKLRANGKP